MYALMLKEKERKKKAQLYVTLIIIKMIEQKISILLVSEGSCDTEDWRNDF